MQLGISLVVFRDTALPRNPLAVNDTSCVVMISLVSSMSCSPCPQPRILAYLFHANLAKAYHRLSTNKATATSYTPSQLVYIHMVFESRLGLERVGGQTEHRFLFFITPRLPPSPYTTPLNLIDTLRRSNSLTTVGLSRGSSVLNSISPAALLLPSSRYLFLPPFLA